MGTRSDAAFAVDARADMQLAESFATSESLVCLTADRGAPYSQPRRRKVNHSATLITTISRIANG